MTEPTVEEHLKMARERARSALNVARDLLDVGFPGPALIWAVRAAEVLMRDFVLAPHFMQAGETWHQALKRGSRVLGDSSWTRAFAKADEWWGPFDEPLTEDGRNAWDAWATEVLRRRGDIVHGRPVSDVTLDEAAQTIAFVDRMGSWYSQRFLVSPRHPINGEFRAVVDAALLAVRGETQPGTPADVGGGSSDPT